jgi:transcriptional regulator with XRE-family HTH domain
MNTAMPSVAEQLRAERERQKRTVHEVADATNIKADHIRALEAGEWKVFSAPVYIRGFTRTYAKELRLDSVRLVAELEEELGRTDDYAEPPSLTGGGKGPLDFITLWLSRVRWQWAFPVLIGVVVVAACVAGYRAWSSGRTATGNPTVLPAGSGLYQPSKPAPGPVLPLPTNTAPSRVR